MFSAGLPLPLQDRVSRTREEVSICTNHQMRNRLARGVDGVEQIAVVREDLDATRLPFVGPRGFGRPQKDAVPIRRDSEAARTRNSLWPTTAFCVSWDLYGTEVRWRTHALAVWRWLSGRPDAERERGLHEDLGLAGSSHEELACRRNNEVGRSPAPVRVGDGRTRRRGHCGQRDCRNRRRRHGRATVATVDRCARSAKAKRLLLCEACAAGAAVDEASRDSVEPVLDRDRDFVEVLLVGEAVVRGSGGPIVSFELEVFGVTPDGPRPDTAAGLALPPLCDQVEGCAVGGHRHVLDDVNPLRHPRLLQRLVGRVPHQHGGTAVGGQGAEGTAQCGKLPQHSTATRSTPGHRVT